MHLEQQKFLPSAFKDLSLRPSERNAIKNTIPHLVRNNYEFFRVNHCQRSNKQYIMLIISILQETSTYLSLCKIPIPIKPKEHQLQSIFVSLGVAGNPYRVYLSGHVVHVVELALFSLDNKLSFLPFKSIVEPDI